MALFEAHTWVRFATGLIVGCWGGALIGAAIAILFVSRRIRQLETANMLLRVKLRSRERKPQRTGTGGSPVIVMPPKETNRSASAPLTRYASGDR